MRYFLKLSYRGTNYSGWQIQPADPSIQEKITAGFSTILRTPIEITGCGRTDAGVHARGYVAHFDYKKTFPEDFLKRINHYLPEDIVIHSMSPVAMDAHARFEAIHRAYEYHIVFSKTPFDIDTAFYYPFSKELDFEKLQSAASLLLEYSDFFPFCKTNTQVKTMRCELYRSEWIINQQEGKMVFHISANRFLRGMVRLIVGMCLNVSSGKITLEEVKQAMDKQVRLTKSLSVPAQGLYLVDIRYPFDF